MKRILSAVLFLLICAPLFSGDAPSVDRIIRDYNSIRTIKASIRQQVYMPGGETRLFSGDYYADNKGNLRIDYSIPAREVVINNSYGLFWYYPEERVVYEKRGKGGARGYNPLIPGPAIEDDLSGLSVSYEGTEFYSFFKRAAVFTIRSERGGGEVRIWTDPDGLYVIRKYILDSSGREEVREIYSEHICTGGVYLPGRIEIFARTSRGILHTVTLYSNVVINSPLDEALFRFTEGKGYEERRLDDLSY